MYTDASKNYNRLGFAVIIHQVNHKKYSLLPILEFIFYITKKYAVYEFKKNNRIKYHTYEQIKKYKIL